MLVFEANPSEGLVNAIAHAHGKAPRTHGDVHIFPACRCFIFVVVITNCIASVVEKFRCCCRAGWVDPGLLPGAGRQFPQFWQTQILDCYQAPGTSSWTATRHRAPAQTTQVLAETPFWRDLRAYHGGTIFEHKSRQTQSSKALLWRDFRVYHGSTISSTIRKSRAQKIAQEIFRAQFTNREHKKYSTRNSTISSTIHKK